MSRPAGTRSLVFLLAAVLAACSGGATPAPSDAPPAGLAPLALDGRTFIATAVTGRSLVPGTEIRLSFEDGQIGVSAGCNSMGGPFGIDGGRLAIGQLATTEMACDPVRMDQDAWIAGILPGAEVALDGDTLTLAGDGVVLRFLDRRVADPDRPLLGTRWVVDGLVAGDSVSSVPAGVVATLAFGDGRVAVEAGCNSGGGPVQVDDTTLAFGPLGLTEMACGPEATAVEQAVTRTLSGTVDYAIEADVLTLGAGATGLVLRAAH